MLKYGIDLIISDGEAATVYQCKNKQTYTANDLRDDLALFRRAWLEARPSLPKPGRFVLCCSAELTERDSWPGQKDRFFEETGVPVEEWSRQTLDVWLRRNPDIVAELFGNHIAELFCERKDWNLGIFSPLGPDCGERDVERYLARQAAGGIIRDEALALRFADILHQRRLVLFGGLSGSGKTITSLDLAASLDGGSWRVF